MKLRLRLLKVLLLSLAIMFTQWSYAQEKKNITAEMKNATADFQALRYMAAIGNLNKVLTKDSTNVVAQDMLAYSHKMVKNYPEALKGYEKLVKQKSVKPEWALYYAESLASNQQYESAEGWYRKYLTLVPADKRAALFARSNAGTFNENLGNWSINFLNINTQSSEYSPAFYQNGLLFSSNRKTAKPVKRTFQWDQSPFTNLYYVPKLGDLKAVNPDSLLMLAKAQKDHRYKFNDDDTAPTSNDTKTLGTYHSSIVRDTLASIIPTPINLQLLKGNINTKYHEAAAAVFPDGSIIYTRNNFVNGRVQKSIKGINKLKLYTASGDGLNKITEFPHNSNEYSTGHPTLNQNGTIMIFASDRPGGLGGTDLYYTVRSGNGNWNTPVNMGKRINTEGDELFPYLGTNNTLYFASTGHAGLGGLDIFEVTLKEMSPVDQPKNMGAPINSPKDDFSLIKSADGKQGYFSSNRRGNDDIYHFKRTVQLIILQGIVTDARTRIPLANSRLVMRHVAGADTLTTNANGEFKRVLPKDTDYELTAHKSGFVNKIAFVTSQGITRDSIIKMDIKLNKVETQQQTVLSNCETLKKTFAVNNIYYDLDRSEIRSDALPTLEELFQLMKKHPEIRVITSSHCDSRASDDYNRKLSLRRGHAAKAFLVKKGISADRIQVEYYGKTRIINRCYDDVPCSAQDQQLNRRTEFDIILHGVNITRQDCEEAF
ncbi:OmpA family protein [Pedobacter sp.]|uniref:OmpA family protein n=1 Tax=Pedobacter sp. TaxID=1411316 RepID=UPI003D7F98E0